MELNDYTKNIIILSLLSVLAKIIVFFVIPINLYDLNFYYDTIIIPFVSSGSLPFINHNIDYPILMIIPVFVAAIPSIIFMNKSLFLIIFPLLMILCDVISTLCIYSIVMKIYNNTNKALLASILFITSLSTAYFVISRYDALPTCIMMIGLAFIICNNDNQKSYTSIIIGFFTKIFPIILLPFIIIYNSKSTNLKQEIISTLKILIPLSLLICVPLVILNPSSITTYFIQMGSRTVGDIYVNTLTYTLYAWIHGVLGINIEFNLISTLMYIIMGIILISLLYLAYSYPEKNPIFLLKLSLCAIFTIIIFSRVHSPQYMIWFSPILCILVIDSNKKILLLYLTQLFLLVEFPLAWGYMYVNNAYINITLSLIFFTIEYIVLFYMIWVAIDGKTLILVNKIKYTSKF